ncbi:Peptidyl-prolyl cis-trans isomerase fkbp19, chloroplastic, variant 2 [Dionaea muscipula]
MEVISLATSARPTPPVVLSFDLIRHRFSSSMRRRVKLSTSSSHGANVMGCLQLQRRQVLELMAGLGLLYPFPAASRSEFADLPALRGKDYGKSKIRYPDYIETESGLQYKDLRVGSGPTPKSGQVVVIDWDGYTIGYYGRIFEARNKTKGGSFEGEDKEFFKFRIGSQEVIPAFEEAISGMSLGGVRRF